MSLRQARGSFFKKRTKKFILAGGVGDEGTGDHGARTFFGSFFQKRTSSSPSPPQSAFRLSRTTGFQLALRSAGLSVAGALVVFGIIYNASQRTMRLQLDAAVDSAQTDIFSDSEDDKKPILESVQDAVTDSAGTFYALTGPDGHELAGNLAITPQLAAVWRGWRTLDQQDGVLLPSRITAIRGVATRLPGGDTLYVAENASSLRVLNRLIVRAFLAVFGAILALALVGGLLVARGTARRVEAMSGASRDIMHGDLSRRIGLSGSGDEFDRLAQNLNAMLERIQALMENVRQVSNDIAHDLRSPLARLREHLELSRRSSADSAAVAAFDEALSQVDTALAIFAAMLRIAEVEAGARRRNFAPVDLSNLLADLTETFETVAEGEAMTVSAAIDPDIAILGDRELITQMLVNVIENAIRHAPAGTSIALGLNTLSADAVQITIADTGPGIPAHERARVLQRFVRLDGARQGPGAGLGLALVAAVVDLHDGGIVLEDNNPGLRVRITLPRVSTTAVTKEQVKQDVLFWKKEPKNFC